MSNAESKPLPTLVSKGVRWRDRIGTTLFFATLAVMCMVWWGLLTWGLLRLLGLV